MRLRHELTAVVLGFVALSLLLVFAATGLFLRMGPAIERILLRNDATIEAAEEILAVLARDEPEPEGEVERVALAVERIANNVTEEGEQAIVDAVQRQVDAALAGDERARRELVEALERLIAVNRTAMYAVDSDARRLGLAGAWASVFVGMVSMGLGLFLYRSLGRRVVRPILEVRDVLVAVRGGDRFRRCSARGVSNEIRDVMDELDHVLDELAVSDEELEVQRRA